MPIDVHPKRRPPTPEEIIAQQKKDASRTPERARKATVKNGPVEHRPADTQLAVKPAALPASAADNRTPVDRYVDDIAGSSLVGRMIKFSKDGKFITADDDAPVDKNIEFIALMDQVLIGWIRFHNDGETPPDRVQGLLFEDFVMPRREVLGDTDATEWPQGLSGAPEDPWKHQICLPLQQSGTNELFTFVTTSTTGRRATGNLLKIFKRMQRTNPGELPVVKLRAGSFRHRDERIGLVAVPAFDVVGRAPRDSAAKPDTGVAADLNDELPGF